MIIWQNGRLLAEEEVRISPFDQGMTVGCGAFETLVAAGGRPLAFEPHWKRLERSCEILGLDVPDASEVKRAIAEVIAANELPEARVRITVTAGPGPLGSARGAGAPTVIVAAAARPVWPATARVVTVRWCRNERGALVGAKSTSYAENVVALAHARARGADEAIFANTRGELCEGTGSNIFLVQNGRLVTPPLASGCLDGITRGLVLALARDLGIGCAETGVPVAALAEAEEAFLTSSTRDLHPIATVDDRPLPAAPGPVTARLQAAWPSVLESLRQ